MDSYLNFNWFFILKVPGGQPWGPLEAEGRPVYTYIYIYIYIYTSVSPCIKCTEKLWNRVCKNTTYRIRVDSVPHMGDLRMYERSHEPFLHLVQWDRTCKHIMESLSNMFGNMENTELPRPGKLERESELKTWCRVNISKPWPWTNCQKHFQSAKSKKHSEAKRSESGWFSPFC